MKVLDTRRFTGANLLLDAAGPVLDVEVGADHVDAVVALWRANLAQMLPALGWDSATVAERRFQGGVTLAFTAPIDVLYAACEVNEWAIEGGDFDQALVRLSKAIEDESNPKLLALRDAAEAKDVAFLWDDDAVSVGLGVGSHTWPADALPAPKDVSWDQIHDIPVVMVTGTNGKSTTVRLIAAMVAADGKTPGLSTTDWIRVGDDILDAGDYSGPGGARAVLRDQRCDVAVLETARGGMLRRGVGYERADAVAVLNVAEDHLGEWGINNLAGLVDAKFVMAQALRTGGAFVLNADEPCVLERGLASPCERKIWFSLDPALAKAAAGDGASIQVVDGVLLAQGASPATYVAESDIAMTLAGRARFNTSNAMAAVALARCVGISDESICAGLRGFDSSPTDNPGRGNLFHINGHTVIADFAHNPHGMRALFATARAFDSTRTAILLGQAGDRTDADVRALVAAIWAGQPDLIVVKTMNEYMRGRAEGEMVALIDRELALAGVPADIIRHADDELAAAQVALAWAQPGDLLLLPLHAMRSEVLAHLAACAGGD